MTVYKYFIGIDIAKSTFAVVLYGAKQASTHDNSPSGFKDFIKTYKSQLRSSFCVLETTGEHEMALLTLLIEKGYKVHRADTRKVKHFIRARQLLILH